MAHRHCVVLMQQLYNIYRANIQVVQTGECQILEENHENGSETGPYGTWALFPWSRALVPWSRALVQWSRALGPVQWSRALVQWSQGPGPMVPGPGPMVPGPWALVQWPRALGPGPWAHPDAAISGLFLPRASHIVAILAPGQPYRDYSGPDIP